VFVLAGTISFAVEGRRREIALLRAVGATPGQVRRMLLLETASIGLVAGGWAATVLFGPFVHALISVGLAPDGFAVTPLWIPYAIATAVGAVVALLATVLAAHRALAVRPGEALVEFSLPQRRLGIVRALLGVVVLGGGVTLVIVLSSNPISYATLAAFCFMIAVALLGPIVVGWPAAVHVLVARAGGGLPPAVAQAAARLTGARVAGVVSTDVFLLDRQLANQGDSWDAAGLDPAASRGTLDLDVRAGSLQALRGDSIAVSDTIAHHRVGLGTVLDARLADATPARLRVVAIYRRSNGLGDVVLPRRLALAHAVAPLDAAVYVTGGNDREVARGLEAIVRAVPSAVIRSRVAYLADVKAQDQENARSQWVVVVLMILIAAMAAFNTGAMAAAERRHELVLARLSGATRGQVIGATALESLLTTLAGIGIGVAVVLVSLSGAPNDPRGGMLVIPWGQAGLVLGGALALGLLGTLLPAAFVGRARLTALAGLRG
jgi:putative ABC transport system permease protein